MGVGVGGSGGSGASAGRIRAGNAYVELGLDSGPLRKGLKDAGTLLNRTASRAAAVSVQAVRLPSAVLASASRALSGLGSISAKLGAGLLGGAGLAGGLFGERIAKSIGDTAEIDKVSKAFGLAAESASGLFGVLAANGADNARENIESLVTLAGRVKDVVDGVGEESQKLFDGLSVTAEGIAKLPIDEQFFRVHEAISKLPDPIDRVNRLMLAFGEDGGKTLIGTLSKSTKELRDQAKTLAIGRDEMDAATEAQKAFGSASVALNTVWRQLGVALAPTIRDAAGSAAAALGPLARWVGGNRRLVVTLAGVIVGAGAAGVALLGLGAVLSAAGTVLGTVAAAAGALASPVGLAGLAVAGLGRWFLTSTDRGKDLAAVLTGKLTAGVQSFAATAKVAWGGIADALKAGDLALAGEVALAALNVEFTKWTAEILKGWVKFKAELKIGANVLSEALGLPDIKKDLEGLSKSMNPGKPKLSDPGHFIDPANADKTGSWFDWSRFRMFTLKQDVGFRRAKPEEMPAWRQRMGLPPEPGDKPGEPGKPAPPPEVGDTKRDIEKGAAHFFNALTRPFITGEEYRQRQRAIDEDYAAASKAAGDRLRQGIQAIREGAAVERKQVQDDAADKLRDAEARLNAKITQANVKAAGETLSGLAVVGLALSGPLAAALGSAGLKEAGVKLPDFTPPERKDDGVNGADKSAAIADQFRQMATQVKGASLRNASAATYGLVFGAGDKVDKIKDAAKETTAAVKEGNKLLERTKDRLEKAGPLVFH